MENAANPNFFPDRKKAITAMTRINIIGGIAVNASDVQSINLPQYALVTAHRNANLLVDQSVNCSVFSAIGMFDAKSNSLLSSANIHRRAHSFTSEPSNDSTTDEDSD